MTRKHYITIISSDQKKKCFKPMNNFLCFINYRTSYRPEMKSHWTSALQRMHQRILIAPRAANPYSVKYLACRRLAWGVPNSGTPIASGVRRVRICLLTLLTVSMRTIFTASDIIRSS